ncbi:MAG: hypothetical protein A2508_08195 [Candidatus Lambdaproteobacteria bacterium RIFOXYD12_FULL_49_8]|nr:MAG: hypothetical protein A2508_08195 [Candidatus Lambdaproteobacteria bacterium RIFOXYD12_FULL_49_8]
MQRLFQQARPLPFDYMKKLALLLSLLFTTWSAQAAYVVQGQIRSEAGSATAGLNVVLIEQNPNKAPQGPLALGKTDQDGRFRIEIEELDPQSEYILGTRIGEQRAASEAFSFAQSKQVTQDLNIPAQQEEVAPEGHNMDSPLVGPFIFVGDLKAEAGPVDSVTVELMEMTISSPEGQAVQTTQTNKAGHFSLQLPQAGSHNLYYVLAKNGPQLARSEARPLAASDKGKEIKTDLVFMAVSQDPKALIVRKNLLFFELMEDRVRVSEILLIENISPGSLDLSGQPLVKALPKGAENFQLMRPAPGISAQLDQDQAQFSITMAPGMAQIFFSYDLNLDQLGQTLTSGLLPRTEEIELVRTASGFEVTFDTPINEVVETKKGHGEELFFSKKTLALSDQKNVKFVIESTIMPQKRLFYPATLLLVLLLCGLFWYIKIKPEKAA